MGWVSSVYYDTELTAGSGAHRGKFLHSVKRGLKIVFLEPIELCLMCATHEDWEHWFRDSPSCACKFTQFAHLLSFSSSILKSLWICKSNLNLKAHYLQRLRRTSGIISWRRKQNEDHTWNKFIEWLHELRAKIYIRIEISFLK